MEPTSAPLLEAGMSHRAGARKRVGRCGHTFKKPDLVRIHWLSQGQHQAIHKDSTPVTQTPPTRFYLQHYELHFSMRFEGANIKLY